MARTGDEVERLSLALNRMIQRLDESYQVASRFSADASHELRTPLTIMRGELESLLKDGGLRDEQAGQVESILEEAERLTQIVEGLLTISRLDAGESQMNKDPVDLSLLAQTTVEQMEPLAEDKSLNLVCRVDAAVMVEANEVRLKQVIVNLLDNAIKYTPEGGKIDVRVLATASEAVLEVADNGIGISSEALPHIFERFYRSGQVVARRAGRYRPRFVGGAVDPRGSPRPHHRRKPRECRLGFSRAAAATGVERPAPERSGGVAHHDWLPALAERRLPNR